MNFERLSVVKRPGFDCWRDNANCPGCQKKPDDHGIYGGGYWFGVTTLRGARHVSLVLEVLGIHYPPSVPRPLYEPVRRPRGGVLMMHHETTDGSGEKCDFLGGRMCAPEVGGYLRAGELYRDFGNMTEDPSVDLSVQSDAFWDALGAQMFAWIDPPGAN